MRTDRTTICTACRIRVWPVRRCPACETDRALGDLSHTSRDELERRSARAAGGAGSRWLGLGSIGSAGIAVSAIASGSVGLAELGVLGAVVLGVGAALLRPRRVGTGPYQVLDAPVIRAAMPRVARVGRVKAITTITSPLRRRAVVGYRLAAATELEMPLDDGRAVAFVLVTDDGDEIDVEASVATLELALPEIEPRPLEDVGEDTARWLAQRGVRDAGPVREAILEDGDRVEVVATPRTESRADGYRGHVTREVLQDVPGSPLIVRSPPYATTASRT